MHYVGTYLQLLLTSTDTDRTPAPACLGEMKPSSLVT